MQSEIVLWHLMVYLSHMLFDALNLLSWNKQLEYCTFSRILNAF